jgi:ferredoxin-like protein FixX
MKYEEMWEKLKNKTITARENSTDYDSYIACNGFLKWIREIESVRDIKKKFARCTTCSLSCNNKILVPWDYPLCPNKTEPV